MDNQNQSKNFLKSEWCWPSIIIVAWLLINLINIGDYGASYDERPVMRRGESTVRFLENIVKTGDFRQKQDGDYQFHPPFYATCSFLTSELCCKVIGLDSVEAGHVLNLFTGALGLAGVFFLGRLINGYRTGLVALTLMALYPRYIAHAHYNGKDVPVMVFVLWTFAFLLRGLSNKSMRDIIIGGIAFGLCVDTKLDGLFILPVLVLTACTFLYFKVPFAWKSYKTVFWLVALFFGTAAGIVYVFWPLLWQNPLFIVKAVGFFSGNFLTFEQAYLGKWYENDQLPWHYLPVHLLACSPVITVFFFLIGLAVCIYWITRYQKIAGISLMFWWLLLPLLSRMRPGSLQYDGIRHVFVTIPPIIIISAVGIDKTLAWLNQRGLRHIPGPAVVLILVITAFPLIALHPYEGSFVNVVGRSLVAQGKTTGEYYDFYSWGAPMIDAVKWLNKNAKPDANVSLENDWELLRYYSLRSDIKTVGGRDRADFVVVSGFKEGFSKENPNLLLKYAVVRYHTTLIAVYAKAPTVVGMTKE